MFFLPTVDKCLLIRGCLIVGNVQSIFLILVFFGTVEFYNCELLLEISLKFWIVYQARLTE